MKSVNCILIVSALIAVLACDKNEGPAPTEAQKRVELLIAGNGKWTPPATGAVLLGEGSGAIDITELFKEFTITFTKTGYTTTGTTPVWPRSGTWEFKDDKGEVFTREDGLEVTLIEIKNNSLKFTMKWDETLYARTHALAGKHTFTFAK